MKDTLNTWIDREEKKMDNKDKIKVIFRKWNDGDILALFPEEIVPQTSYNCYSYACIGDYGLADPILCMRETVLATPKEYAKLLKKLQYDGYDLIICKDYAQNMTEKRIRKYDKFMKIIKKSIKI